MMRVLPALAAALVLGGLIVALSLLPVDRIPRFAPSLVEHFAAYGGAMLAVGLFRPPLRWLVGLGLLGTAAAAGLEVLQPAFGRTATIGDFAASAAGVWLGVALLAALRWLKLRKGRPG